MSCDDFKKEYVTGRKDQWDIDYKIIMKGHELSKTVDEYFEFLRESMTSVIARVSSDRARELLKELELL